MEPIALLIAGIPRLGYFSKGQMDCADLEYLSHCRRQEGSTFSLESRLRYTGATSYIS